MAVRETKENEMRVTTAYLERVAREWQAAYLAANGKTAPPVVWEKGWFKVGAIRYRRQRLEEMTQNLKSVGQRGPVQAVIVSN
jgi:2-methylcitrate dehydratase PrpD